MSTSSSLLITLGVVLALHVHTSTSFTVPTLGHPVLPTSNSPSACVFSPRLTARSATGKTSLLSLRAELKTQASSKYGKLSAAEASKNLVQVLAEGEAKGSVDRETADYLINVLVQSGSSFSGDLLSRGNFRVAYTKNSTPFWQTLGSLLPIKKNDSFQDYDLSAGKLVSKAQIVGDDFCVVADADVKEADVKVKKMPKDFDVLVTGVKINVGALQIPIPVRGVGLARMLYQDERLRIFVSPNSDSGWEEKGLIAVQVPAVQ